MKQHEINTSFVQMRLNFASSSCPVTHRQTVFVIYVKKNVLSGKQPVHYLQTELCCVSQCASR